MPLLCPQSKQLIVLRLYRIMRIVDCHVPIILSLHIYLGVCYRPDSLAVPLTLQGIHIDKFYFTSLSPHSSSICISAYSRFRPVHSQIRQTFLSFSPYIFYRPPTYRIHRSPLNSFRIHISRFTVSLSRLHRASDKIGFPIMPVGVSGKAFQGVTPSFHLSDYQFS